MTNPSQPSSTGTNHSPGSLWTNYDPGKPSRANPVAAFLLAVLLAVLCSCPALGVRHVQLTGYGASFPSSVYTEWNSAYREQRSRFVNLDMTYVATGSTKGIKYITGTALLCSVGS